MGRFKLARGGKILAFLLIVAMLAGGIWQGVDRGWIKLKKNSTTTQVSKQDTSKKTDKVKETAKIAENNIYAPDRDDDEINLSLDEWVGWKEIIDAAGGLTTQPGSIFDQLGLRVNIHVINDAAQSSNALIKGDLDAAGYTINRTAFLSQKFSDAGVPVIMPYITNYSNGGDGIIATDKFQTVESLVDAKIGVPQFSEAHSLVVWFVNQSDLTADQKQHIIDNLIFFDTPDEAAKAFFAGQIDVAATWQPYLTQATSTSNCHVLFSTANSTKLIMDGILFRDDFAKSNPDLVSKFIQGCLIAGDKYTTEFDAIREVMPMFAGESDDSIRDMTADAALTTYASNLKTLKDEAPIVYTDMCKVWESVGETVNNDLVNTLFDTSYAQSLESEFNTLSSAEPDTPKVVVTEENRQKIIDTQALLSKSVTVNFVANTCNFMDNAEAAAALNGFVEIAKTLDGTVIQIEGNVASDNTTDAEMILSEQRAETVKKYLIVNGIDAKRIITVGNGGTKPVMPNRNPDGTLSKEATDANRRTDIYFKTVE